MSFGKGNTLNPLSSGNRQERSWVSPSQSIATPQHHSLLKHTKNLLSRYEGLCFVKMPDTTRCGPAEGYGIPPHKPQYTSREIKNYFLRPNIIYISFNMYIINKTLNNLFYKIYIVYDVRNICLDLMVAKYEGMNMQWRNECAMEE